MTLYYKGNSEPQEIPFQDTDPNGNAWTNLANNPEGRQFCGWHEAPPKPSFNAATQHIIWNTADHDWEVQTNPPAPDPEPVPNNMQPSPPQFFLLFTAQERAVIRAVATGNPIMADWMAILNDPRLTFVDLTLNSTKMGVMYLTTLDIPDSLKPYMPSGQTKILTNDRATAVLSGKPI